MSQPSMQHLCQFSPDSSSSTIFSHVYSKHHSTNSSGWLHGKAVEPRSLAGKLSLSCAQPVADN